MARTKKPSVSKSESKSKPKTTVSQSAVKEAIDDREKYFLKQLEHFEQKLYADLDDKYKHVRVMIPGKLLNYTIEQIVNGDVPYSELSSSTIVHSTVLSDATHNNTTQNKTVTKLKGKRSTSCDDGYTSESTRTTHSGGRAATRQSRSKTKNSSVATGSSRSLTRSRNNLNSIVTPFNKLPPATNAGSITPKIKPNVPIFCMRRPKTGEMAWSNQGSPLLVSTCTTDQSANINIPVGNDAMWSILPHRGALRQSQIPEFDHETHRQLEALRDNLIKVCSIKKMS